MFAHVDSLEFAPQKEYLNNNTKIPQINPHQYTNGSTTMMIGYRAHRLSQGRTHGFSILNTEEIELEPISKVLLERHGKVDQLG